MTDVYRDTNVTIGTTDAVICEDLDINDRVEVTITNISPAAQIISLSMDKEAEASKGRVLSVGGYYSASEDAAFKPTKKAIHAISSAAGGIVAISERIRVS